MRKRIAAVAVGLVLSATAHAQNQPNNFAPLSTPGGRFVLGQIDPARADQFLLDTQTGRVWQIVCAEREPSATTCQRTVLQPVFFTTGFAGVGYSTYPPSNTVDAPPAPKK